MIPRIIHQIWLGSEVPSELRFYSETWKYHHDHWVYQLWTDANLFPLRNQALFDRAEEIAPQNVGQFRADIARYEILHKMGGIYVDMDFECVRNLDRLLEPVTCFAAWEEQDKWINNAIMGCQPGDPFMDLIIKAIPTSVEAHLGARPNKLTGPQLVTRLYRKHEFGPYVTIFDKELFYPYLYNELHRKGQSFPNAYAIHHWNNARRKVHS